MTEPISLHWVDWAIIVAYILFSLGVGSISPKEQPQVQKNIFFPDVPSLVAC